MEFHVRAPKHLMDRERLTVELMLSWVLVRELAESVF